jgi:Flp pilus assembly protein TadG
MIRAQKRKRVALPHFRKEAHGQASIEFIFTVGFLVLFILGMIEVVMLVYTYSVLADSAKEGVRYAVVHGSGNASGSGPGCGDSTGANVKTVVTNYAEYSFHSTSGMTVNVTYPESACTAPSLVRVTVSYPYQPFFGLGWPTVTVRAAAEGRIAY